MRATSTIRAAAVLGCALAMGSVTGCYDDEPVAPAAPARTGTSTIVVSKPGVTAPQPTVVQQAPAPQSPPIINNVVQPAPAAAPTSSPAPDTTVNVQPKTVVVPQ